MTKKKPTPKKKITFASVIGWLFGCFVFLLAYGMVKDYFILPVLRLSQAQQQANTPRPKSTMRPRATATSQYAFQTHTPAPVSILAGTELAHKGISLQLESVTRHDTVNAGNGYYYTPKENDQIVGLVFLASSPSHARLAAADIGVSFSASGDAWAPNLYSVQAHDGKRPDPFAAALQLADSRTVITLDRSKYYYLRFIFFVPKNKDTLYFGIEDSDLLKIDNP